MAHRGREDQGTDGKRQTSFGRQLHGLEDGDAIGIIDAVSQMLETLETAEAADNAELEIESDVRASSFQTPVGGAARDGGADSTTAADAGPASKQALVAADDVDLAPSHVSGTVAAGGEGMEGEVGADATHPSAADSGPRQRPRLALRPKKRTQRVSQCARASPTGAALFGTKADVPFTQGISNYFSAVGSTQEKRVTALSAWALSVVGLLICLVFVTRDFFSSRKAAMIAVRYELANEVVLPEAYLCNRQWTIPMFWRQAGGGHIGDPTVWIHEVKQPGNRSQAVRYPLTHEHPNIAAVTIDAYGRQCSDASLQLADAAAFYQSILGLPRCFHCVHVKDRPPVRIRRADAAVSRGGIDKNALSLQMSASSAVEACRKSIGSLEFTTLAALRSLVLRHAGALQERKILDFSAKDPFARDAFGEFQVFPRERYVDTHGYRDLVVSDVVDTLCNTVLFSGYFYPKPPAQDVSFKYDLTSDRWVRTGRGPFVPPRLADWYVLPERERSGAVKLGELVPMKPPDVQPLTTPLTQLRAANATNNVGDGSILRVYIRGQTESSPLRQVAELKMSGTVNVFFERSVFHNVTSFDSTSEGTSTHTVDGRNVNFNFLVQLSVRDFVTPRVTRQVTIQATSFIADFFGLIELFLDLSVYTLIISPVIVATKRRAMLARVRAHAAHSPPSPA